MAILLKEITIRYSPKGDSFLQAIRDYYAMFNLWRTEGSGGQAGATNQRRSELIDDVFEQVAETFGKKLLDRFGKEWVNYAPHNRKDIGVVSNSLKLHNWLDFHGAMEKIMYTIMGDSWMSSLKKADKNPKEMLSMLSPSIQNLVQRSSQFADIPKPEPKWKAYDKPMNARGSLGGTQIDLPMAGGQMDLPLAPGEKLPQMPRNLPKMDTPFASDQPKRLAANWEKVMEKFGYKWSEADNGYKNEDRNMLIQIQPSNAARVFFPNGKSEVIPNLGKLFRRMQHNKNRRHKKEPAAQVTEDNFKQLYEFLYT